MDYEFVPGSFVRRPEYPEWGLGQVQSAIGNKVTVNFEHAGKVALNIDNARLSLLDPDDPFTSESQ
jgi:hypothetical protein